MRIDSDDHQAGNPACDVGWCGDIRKWPGGSNGYPRPCGMDGCGGLIHATFGWDDEPPDYEVVVFTRCDGCGRHADYDRPA